MTNNANELSKAAIYFALQCLTCLTYAGQYDCPPSLSTPHRTILTATKEGNVCTFSFSDDDSNDSSPGIETKTVITYSNDRQQLLRLAGMAGDVRAFRIRLINPRYPGLIEERHPLSAKGLVELKMKGWKINAEVIGYRDKGDQPGPTFLCATALQSTRRRSTAVSECSQFYPEGIRKFREILNYVSSTP